MNRKSSVGNVESKGDTVFSVLEGDEAYFFRAGMLF